MSGKSSIERKHIVCFHYFNTLKESPLLKFKQNQIYKLFSKPTIIVKFSWKPLHICINDYVMNKTKQVKFMGLSSVGTLTWITYVINWFHK